MERDSHLSQLWLKCLTFNSCTTMWTSCQGSFQDLESKRLESFGYISLKVNLLLIIAMKFQKIN